MEKPEGDTPVAVIALQEQIVTAMAAVPLCAVTAPQLSWDWAPGLEIRIGF